MKDQAIRNVHPNVITINGESEAWDKDGNVVTLDEDTIATELTRLTARQTILDAIFKLESQETPRRLSEALPDDAGGSADGRAWLKANRDKIIAERDKL